jgi:hypothetical protein
MSDTARIFFLTSKIFFRRREMHYDFTGQSRRGRTARVKRAESIARLASSQPMYSALKAIRCQEA